MKKNKSVKLGIMFSLIFSFLFSLFVNSTTVSAVDRETGEIRITEYEIVDVGSSFYDEDIEIFVFNVPTQELKEDIDYIYDVNVDYKTCDFKLIWCFKESDMKNKTFNYDVNYDLYSDSDSAGAVVFDELKEMGEVNNLIKTDKWYANGSQHNYLHLTGDDLTTIGEYEYYFILPSTLPSNYIKVIYADYVSVDGEEVRWHINTVVKDDPSLADDLADAFNIIADFINDMYEYIVIIVVVILFIILIKLMKTTLSLLGMDKTSREIRKVKKLRKEQTKLNYMLREKKRKENRIYNRNMRKNKDFQKNRMRSPYRDQVNYHKYWKNKRKKK